MVTSGERNKGNKPVRLHRFQVEVSLHTWVILSLINGYTSGRGTRVKCRSDYTDSSSCIDINALAQGIKSFLASQVWFQAVAGARTYGTDSPAITSQPR